MEDVHIRYEDDTTVPGCPFACGIIIKSLAASSTDTSWVITSTLYLSMYNPLEGLGGGGAEVMGYQGVSDTRNVGY